MITNTKVMNPVALSSSSQYRALRLEASWKIVFWLFFFAFYCFKKFYWSIVALECYVSFTVQQSESSTYIPSVLESAVTLYSWRCAQPFSITSAMERNCCTWGQMQQLLKNIIVPNSHKLEKKIQMPKILKYKTWHHKTPRKEHRQSILWHKW